MNYQKRITRFTILPKGEPLFSEQAMHIEIVDEAGGEYVQIVQQSGRLDVKEQTVSLNMEEWNAVKEVVEELFIEIEKNEN